MGMKIIVPGVDASALGNPVVVDLVEGFPEAGLQALYLAEDGSVGSTPTTLLDSSGLGNDAPIASGSSAIRTATGIRTDVTPDADTVGFQALTPIDVNSFSIVAAVRHRTTLSTASAFAVVSGSNVNSAGAGANMTGLLGNYGIASRGVLHNNMNGAGATDLADIGSYAQTAAAAAWATAGSSSNRITASAGARASWIAFAMSVDSSVGTVLTRFNGQSVTFTDARTCARWVGKASGSLVFSGQPDDDATITLDGTAFTFKASGATGNQINKGATLALTLTAAVAVLNASVVAGVAAATYSCNATTIFVVHDTIGTGGNAFTLAASSSPASNCTPSASTLANGAAAGKHVTGLHQLGSTPGVRGDFGLFGIYSTVKDATALDALITAAGVRMALRSATVI